MGIATNYVSPNYASPLYVQETIPSVNGFTLDGGKLYVGQYFNIACLNATTGEEIWKVWLHRDVTSSPTYAYGKIYIASDFGILRVLDAKNGTQLSYYHIGYPIWSSPSLYDGMMYVGAHDNNVYCFGQDDLDLTTYYDQSAPQPEGPTSEISPESEEPTAEEPITPEETETPTEPEQPTEEPETPTEEPTEPTEPSEAPLFSATDLTIIAAVAVAVVIGIAAYWILKKRK